MILYEIVDAIALSYYAEGTYTQTQIATRLSENPLVPKRNESTYKRSVTRLCELGLIEAVESEDKLYRRKFYQITSDGKDEVKKIEKLYEECFVQIQKSDCYCPFWQSQTS